MRNRPIHLKNYLLGLLFAVTPLYCVGTPASAQSMPVQDNKPVQDNDTTRKDLAQFDQFLDSHREIAEQLRKDPSLVNKKEYVDSHPALQAFLRDQPGVREEIRENPNAFMREENRFDRTEDRRDNDTTRKDLAQFDRFLDSHREIAEQLRKDPSLVNKKEFVDNHPALQTFLRDQPGVREEIRENPNAFMRQENSFDRTEDRRDNDTTRTEDRRDNDTTRAEDKRDNDATRKRDNDTARKEDTRDRDTTRPQVAKFDQFLDSHREIAEQLRKDPSLVNKKEYVDNHPALQSFLQDQPGVREEIRENPNAFMREENRFDRTENRGDNDTTRRQQAQFNQFLDSHREIAEQLHKDPSLVNKKEFVDNHPELQTFLRDQPGVRNGIKENPNAFMRQENSYDRREDMRDRDTPEGHAYSFGKFLGGHSSMAEQVSKDPSLVKNQEYVKNHPELQEYLKANPGVQHELMENPQSFVKAAQQSNSTNSGSSVPAATPTTTTTTPTTTTPTPTTKTPTPAEAPKPKQ